ncbi:hypothetical protein PENSPDRAFT_131491 [Peniophora sp. CONT]|nr:hypothetical protein PENSPDRAFT_131491 [Peniophora sp. CONT]
MTDWMSLETQATNMATLVKIIHLLAGFFIGEYVSHFKYEWAFLSGKRRWHWTTPIYMSCRLFAVITCLLLISGFNASHEIDCAAWMRSILFFGYFSVLLAAVLLIIRTIALWGHQWPITVFLVSIEVASFGLNINAIAKIEAIWGNVPPLTGTCLFINTYDVRSSILGILVSDLILLSVMLAGVLRRKSQSSLWSLLLRQGVVSIALATIIGIPPVTLNFLNLNGAMNMMLHFPSFIAWVVAITGLYRQLELHHAGPEERHAFGTSYLDTAEQTMFNSAPLPSKQAPPLPENMILRPNRLGDPAERPSFQYSHVPNQSLQSTPRVPAPTLNNRGQRPSVHEIRPLPTVGPTPESPELDQKDPELETYTYPPMSANSTYGDDTTAAARSPM